MTNGTNNIKINYLHFDAMNEYKNIYNLFSDCM